MLVSKKSRLHIRTQNIIFTILFLSVIGLLAWLSLRYNVQADWTASNRNTLSATSTELLNVIKAPLSITAYVNEDENLRRRIDDLVKRYQRYKPDIQFSFVNPETEPDAARRLGITRNGEIIIDYEGRSEHLKELSEQAFSNAIQRVVRGSEHWIVFLEGHGERKARGEANHDLEAWVRQLESIGLKVQSLNLAKTPEIPNNTAVLVIAGPQVDLLPGEVKLINDYIDKGGNLLWLSDPGSIHGLEPIAEKLGIEFQPGMIVDPTTQGFGINDPRFAIVTEYPYHPVTQGFNMVTLYPQAAAIDLEVPQGWEGKALLETVDRSWSETDEIKGKIKFDKGKDIPGPLTIGIELHRNLSTTHRNENSTAPTVDKNKADTKTEQRIIVVGDGDFLSNAYLGNGGNLDMGLAMVNWLSHDDTFITIPAKTAPDTNLELTRTAQMLIGFGFLFVFPLALVGSGIFIWMKRRKR